MSFSKKSAHLFRISAILLCLALGAGAAAAKKGKGNGGGGGGGGGGKNSEVAPAKIVFASERGENGNGISGDGNGAYIDGEQGVEAYVGTGGAEGDIFLRLANAPSRGLWLDFIDCVDPDPNDLDIDPCTRPEPEVGVNSPSAIAIAPREVQEGGLYGIPAGETIYAPMDLFYDFGVAEGTGFIYFNQSLKGRNPCKNKSMNAAITRSATNPDLWTVSADGSALACATLPGGDYSGQYRMPFSFTLELLPAP